ncbi:MAG: SDR family oxidoreductase [Acetobacteraceae bacterium]|nr:SDR family oxidoreductase [Acetobacteraceae bacterium]
MGQATDEAIAREGADIPVSYHADRDGAEETRRRVEGEGRKTFVAPADIADPGSVQALFDAAIAALGVPDLLIANAGVGLSGMPVANMEDATRPVDGGLTMNWGGA